MKGKIVTVLGPVEPETIGLTLTHEHLLHGMKSSVFKLPMPDYVKHAEHLPLSLENLGYFRQYPYCYEENIELSNEQDRRAIREEMEFFKRNGGGCIVDNCSMGIRYPSHVEYLTNLSKSTGVRIVAGSGFYVSSSHSQSILQSSVESLADKIRIDLLEGMDGTQVKCGVIGEVGCCWPLSEFEKKSLQATALVQEETGAPVIIHPGRDVRTLEEICRVFEEAGGLLQRTVMSHLDRTTLTKEDLLEFASKGSFCEYDLFGVETSFYQLDAQTPMPSDAQRIQMLKHLVDDGRGDKIVVAHDIHTKHRLMKYGGHGFSHIILNVLPVMKIRGFSEEDIHKILYTNPRTWLTYQ